MSGGQEGEPDVAPKPATAFGVTGIQPEAGLFEVRTLEPGSVLSLTEDRYARVLENPHDGVWLICEMLDADRHETGQIEPVMCYDIVGLEERGSIDGAG